MKWPRSVRLGMISCVVAALGLAASHFVVVVEAAPAGSESFVATGANQTFTTPTGVTAVIVDLLRRARWHERSRDSAGAGRWR